MADLSEKAVSRTFLLFKDIKRQECRKRKTAAGMERSVPEAVFRFQKVARQVGQKHFAATALAVSSHVLYNRHRRLEK